MKKSTKGVIAALLGLGLLGGYGTFALWSDSANLDGGTITAGNLDIAPVAGTAAWTDISPTKANGWVAADTITYVSTVNKPITNIANFLMVPGDLLELDQDIQVIATGDNMAAEITIDPETLGIGTGLENWVHAGLVLRNAANTVIGSGAIGTPLTFNVPKTVTGTPAVYSLEVRIGFDGGALGQQGVTQTVDVGAMDINLNQVRG